MDFPCPPVDQSSQGTISLVQAAYHQVHMYIKHAGRAEFMYLVESGVLQGCPLAALLFVIAMQPFLIMFKIAVEDASLGVVRACADDIAVTLKSIATLAEVFRIF